MALAQFSSEILVGWDTAERISVGLRPQPSVRPDTYVLADCDGVRLCIEIYAPPLQDMPFSDVAVWHGLVVIGYGSTLYLVRIADRWNTYLPIGGYFGSLAIGDGYCLVATDSDILRLSADGTISWRQNGLALDGVLINRVKDGVIDASGQWDPPDAEWLEFRLDLETGQRLDD